MIFSAKGHIAGNLWRLIK